LELSEVKKELQAKEHLVQTLQAEVDELQWVPDACTSTPGLASFYIPHQSSWGFLLSLIHFGSHTRDHLSYSKVPSTLGQVKRAKLQWLLSQEA
jgi:hypothetical protein